MNRLAAAKLRPRKSPQQARSVATVEAIFTAAIQVLLTVGASGLTTTRVAERAGVSVGSMYQYFPHKQALLLMLLERHIETILEAMELAAGQLAGRDLAEVGEGLAEAWLDVKLADLETSRALYLVAAEFDIAALIQQGTTRFQCAIERALEQAADARPADPAAAAFMLAALLGGSVRAVMESDLSQPNLAILRQELPSVCAAYLIAVGVPR